MPEMIRGGAHGASRLARFGLALAVLLASIAVHEVGIRIALPDFDPTRHVSFLAGDDTRPSLGPANTSKRQVKNTGDYNVHIRFNRHGLRDAKDVALARPGDWAVVGNSFMFGWGVAEVDRMSERLEGRIGRPVFNLSNGGGDLDDYERLLAFAARQGARIANVVVAVTMENNLADYDRPRPASARQGPEPWGLRVAKGFLMSHSALYFAATSVVHQFPWLEAAVARLGLMTPNLAAVHDGDVAAEVVQSSVRRVRRLIAPYARAVVVLIPSRALWAGDRRAAAERTHAAVRDGLRAAGVDVVDLRPVFEAESNPLGYHFANDGHWSPRGHARAAEAVADRLLAR